MNTSFTAGIITSSDKCHAGYRTDESGKIIEKMLKDRGYTILKYTILPDEKELLKKEMIHMADILKVNLLLTTGGTGFSERDVVPEAALEVIKLHAPGISEAIRYHSLSITKRAMLSRGISGIRDKTLLINLPGSPKAVAEALEYILESVFHGLEILLGRTGDCSR